MKKYKYPESLREQDFDWIDYWYNEENCNSIDIKRQVQSIIQNEVEISSDDINEYVESIDRLVHKEIEKLNILKSISEQIASKFEEIS